MTSSGAACRQRTAKNTLRVDSRLSPNCKVCNFRGSHRQKGNFPCGVATRQMTAHSRRQPVHNSPLSTERCGFMWRKLDFQSQILPSLTVVAQHLRDAVQSCPRSCVSGSNKTLPVFFFVEGEGIGEINGSRIIHRSPDVSEKNYERCFETKK